MQINTTLPTYPILLFSTLLQTKHRICYKISGTVRSTILYKTTRQTPALFAPLPPSPSFPQTMPLSTLTRSLLERRASSLLLRRHSAVACVTRLADPTDESSLEVLFMTRATRASDKWSGQVAFPGGKQDDTDNDAKHTAERETQEEIGLDLTEGFTYLGQLHDLTAIPKELSLSCYVYHQVGETPPFHLNEKEVASTSWIPLATLSAKENLTDVGWPAEGTPMPFKSLRYMGVRRLHFRGIDLGKLDGNEQLLWGLTLRLVTNLLQESGCEYKHLRRIPYFYYEGPLSMVHNAINTAATHLLSLCGVRLSWSNSIKVQLACVWGVLIITVLGLLHAVYKEVFKQQRVKDV